MSGPDHICLHRSEITPEMEMPAEKWVNPSKAVQYVRRDPAVLAALPEVQALVAEAVAQERERCALEGGEG